MLITLQLNMTAIPKKTLAVIIKHFNATCSSNPSDNLTSIPSKFSFPAIVMESKSTFRISGHSPWASDKLTPYKSIAQGLGIPQQPVITINLEDYSISVPKKIADKIAGKMTISAAAP